MEHTHTDVRNTCKEIASEWVAVLLIDSSQDGQDTVSLFRSLSEMSASFSLLSACGIRSFGIM